LDRHISNLWRNVKKRGRWRGLFVNITHRWVERKVAEFCQRNYYELRPRGAFLPSLDRIKEGIGYTRKNTRVVWLIENYARNGFSDAELIEFCKRKLDLNIS